MPAKTFLMIISLLAGACATAEIGKNITSNDISWIQNGITTRSEIVGKLGHPTSEMPDWTMMDFSTSTTTTTTTKADNGQTQESTSTTTIQTNPKNKFTKALYIHTKSTGGLFVSFETTQEQFGVIYDEKGIVQDHGFSGGMNMTIH